MRKTAEQRAIACGFNIVAASILMIMNRVADAGYYYRELIIIMPVSAALNYRKLRVTSLLTVNRQTASCAVVQTYFTFRSICEYTKASFLREMTA